ncbi:hypothetical protein [Mesorhizobium sp. M0772]|uniref:hypothetical protein n=1 Tax=Mesorhizobium sp. M0772 TaxID=2956998 RepID=UPI003338280F
MSILETSKKVIENVTGFARPRKEAVAGFVRQRKSNEFWFKDDGLVPNHPAWPLVVYRGAVELPEGLDPAAVRCFSMQTDGAIAGKTASMITFTIIRKYTRFWALPAEMLKSGLAARKDERCR